MGLHVNVKILIEFFFDIHLLKVEISIEKKF
jgi:hypothetical protein